MMAAASLSMSLVVSSAAISLCQHGANLDVEALVFSGTDNPRLTLTDEDKAAVCEQMEGVSAVKTCRVLGFTGWKVCDAVSCEVVRGLPAIDNIFLNAFEGTVSDDVLEHVREEADRLATSNDECEDMDDEINGNCPNPVVGSDDPTKVHYDVQNDVDGCWISRQYDNNCYDYGNDIATNTFAQPGRGSGVCAPGSRPCVPNTCDDVKNAAISDGLTWVGTELPTSLPETGHYVSLHIWPNRNFHWLRMDADMYFSHKPGGSAVKNVDNNRNKITDAGNADLSPWTQHCGYMHTVPSKVVPTINAQMTSDLIA